MKIDVLPLQFADAVNECFATAGEVVECGFDDGVIDMESGTPLTNIGKILELFRFVCFFP